jgi:hypothetical protein
VENNLPIPYSVGGIVSGPRFVGRRTEIARIRQRVLDSGHDCTSLVGPPRIGKSSLAWEALMTQEVVARNPGVIPVWISLNTCADLPGLIRELVSGVREKLDHRRALSAPLRHDSDLILRDSARRWEDFYQDTKVLLRQLRRERFRVVAVLDEFDSARSVFTVPHSALQVLRQLGYENDHKVTWVTTSRRELRQIVNQSGAVTSNFPGIFDQVPVRCFSDDEMSELAGLAEAAGVRCDMAECISTLSWLTGGHPWLCAKAMSEVCHQWSALGVIDWQLLKQEMSRFLAGYYEDLWGLLGEDGRADILLEVLFGPQKQATVSDLHGLAASGLLMKTGDGYQAFSAHFADHLRTRSSRLGEDDLWRRAENQVREAIRGSFLANYGIDWPDEIAHRFPEIRSIINRIGSYCEQEEPFTAKAADILDFFEMSDLWTLIKLHWELFEERLGGSPVVWEARFRLLAEIGRPLARGEDFLTSQSARRQAQEYCAKLLGCLAD